MKIQPIEIKRETVDGIERDIETIAVEPWDPSMGISEQEYYAMAFSQFDKEEEKPKMRNGQTDAERRYVLTEDDLMYDCDDGPDDDTLMSFNPNSDSNKEMTNTFVRKDVEATCKSTAQYRADEQQRKIEEFQHHQKVRSGEALRQLAMSLNGRVNDVGEIINAAAAQNTQDHNLKRLFGKGSGTRGTSVSPDFEIINGRYVRKYSPYFSVGNNKYRDALLYFSRFPMDPRLDGIRDLYIEEEQRMVEERKDVFRALKYKPDDMSEEDFERNLDIQFNPYTLHGPEAPKVMSNDHSIGQNTVLWETPIKCKFTMKITHGDGTVEEYEKVIDETHVVTVDSLQQNIINKDKRSMELLYNKDYVYRMAWERYFEANNQRLDAALPGWDKMSAAEWRENPRATHIFNEVAYRIPARRIAAAKKRKELPACPDFEEYAKNIGLNMISNVMTGNTEGDIVIRKMGLTPDHPIYNEYVMKREKEAKWVSEVFYADGRPNMDAFRKKYPFFDAMREAHKLAILYNDTRHSTVADSGATINLPLSIEESLSDDVKAELGLIREMPDPDIIKETMALPQNKGKSVFQVFKGLKETPFYDCFDDDGTLRKEAIHVKYRENQPLVEERKEKEIKPENFPKTIRFITDVPEAARKFYEEDPFEGVWVNQGHEVKRLEMPKDVLDLF